MKSIRSLLVLCAIADVVVLLGAARARRRYLFERGPIRAGVTAMGLPRGFLIGNEPYEPPARFRCALLQYTSVWCPSCDANWQRAAALSLRLTRMGCLSIRLAPSGAELPLRQAQPREVDLEAISPAWLENLPRLELEPTTIALGPGGRILWYSVGELSRTDVASAVAKVRAALR